MVTLKIPPAGAPVNGMAMPAQPLTLTLVTDGKPLMPMVMPVDVTLDGETHAAVDVSTHVIIWPFVNVLVVKIALLVPAFVPLIFH